MDKRAAAEQTVVSTELSCTNGGESMEVDWLTQYPQLKSLYLSNVQPTGKELGYWRWGPVEELAIDGGIYAGKVYQVAHACEREFPEFAAFVRECTIMSELRHPNVVQFLGVCSLPTSKFPVLVTEVLWQSLGEYCLSEKWSVVRWHILTDVAKGLLYLHTHNPPIIHRYLNPVTIMLTSDFVAKITSFRYATKQGETEAQDHHLKFFGFSTWRQSYMPPEGRLYYKTAHCVPSFDVYSCGAVALYVLTHDQFPAVVRTEIEWHKRYLKMLQKQLGKKRPIVQLVAKCLSDDPAQRPTAEELVCQLELELEKLVTTENEPNLIKMRNRRDAQELFTEAMQKGYVLCRLIIVLLVGAAGAGKSHLKQLLLGLPPPDLRQSTPLAEPPIRAVSVSRAVVSSTGKVWHVVLAKELDDMIASSIKARKQAVAAASLLQPASEQEKAPSSTATSSSSEEVITVAMDDSVHSNPSGSATAGSSAANQLALSDLESELLDLVSKSSGSGKLFDVDWVYLLDTGGQPQYQELLPAFLQDAFTFLYVTKLNEPLNHRPTVEYYDSSGQMCGSSYASPLTNQQILLNYLQVMQSRCFSSCDQRKGPSVFVVGTHKDLESESEESRAEKNEKLISLLRPSFGAKLGYYQIADREEIIFPVNGRQPGPDDEEVALKLRNAISEMSQDKQVKIPLPWYAFERFLRKLAAKKGVNILTIEECQEVAERLKMGPGACHAALVFLSKLNILFYDPKVLPGVVFISPQILLDVVTALVYLIHVLRGEKRDESIDLRLSRNVNWVDFRDYGVLTVDLLSSTVFEGHYRHDIFSPHDLMCLLKGRQIVAQVNEKEYVMPCLLSEATPSESEHRRHLDLSSMAFPLLVQYPDRWLPAGVYTVLVAYLQNEAHWRLTLLKSGKPVCFQRRCVEFSLPTGQPGTVTLIDSFEYLEIRIQCAFHDVLQEVCPKIVRSIFEGLERAAEILRYDNLEKPRRAFFCLQKGVKCEDTLHPASIVGGMWTCSENPSVGGKLEERHLLWLQDSDRPRVTSGVQGFSSSTANAPVPCLGDRPQMKQLLCIRTRGSKVVKPIETIASQWDQVAIALGFEWNVIECIRSDAHFQAVPACCRMLSKWLDGKGSQPATWHRFAEALIDAGYTNLAEDIHEIIRD